jgi:hypothetical protein
MYKNKIRDNVKTSLFQKCFFVNNITYIIVIIGIVAIVVCVFSLSKKLGHVKEQLNSCRSSMRGE